MGRREGDTISQLALPPGFRFYPTDEELLVHYLCKKIGGDHFSSQIIGEVDLYQFDPWVLPSKALFGENEWYFFSPRDRKYPNGSRPNRVACSGYWKATGNDKLVSVDGRKVGIKKSLVFYVGKAPKGTKTSWIMHEYRIAEASTKKQGSIRLDDWVLCRIYRKKSSIENPMFASKEDNKATSSSLASFSGEPPSKVDDNLFDFYLPRMNSLIAMQEEFTTLKNLGDRNVNLTSQMGNMAKSSSQTLPPVLRSHHGESQNTTFSDCPHPWYAASESSRSNKSSFCNYNWQ